VIVVLDSSILIGLGGIGRLALLHDLFGEVIIPQAVSDELHAHAQSTELARQVDAASWIRTVPVRNRLAVRVLLHPLDLGEAAVIVLTQELGADLAAVDERQAREKLESLGVNVVGTLGILLKAKREGYIERIRPEIDELRKNNVFLSQSLVEIILDMAGESSL
jgi:predicted nucleic acid-binding protein